MSRAFIQVACLIFGFWLGMYLNKADASEYYGTPIYYSKYFEDSYPCVTVKAELNYCGDPKFPETAVIGYMEAEGVSSSRITLLSDVVCTAGVCSSNYGEPYGRTSLPGTTYWSVPVGYYLDVVEGKVRAVRHGTGALAEVYPIRNVINLKDYQDPPRGFEQKDTLMRYNVYCNIADECSYLGRRMMASELRPYIPRVLTYNCQGWFCYNADYSIAGLNPKAS